MNLLIVDFLLENHVFSPLVAFSLLLAAIGTGSLSLLFLSGLVAYGWPFFYAYLLDVKEKSATEVKAPAARLHTIRPSAVGAH